MDIGTELEIIRGALAAIEAVINAVKATKSGSIDPQSVLASIAALHDQLAANNAMADAVVDERFPK